MNIDLEITSREVSARIRNKYTDGKFILLKEYDKFIRIKKLNKINETKKYI